MEISEECLKELIFALDNLKVNKVVLISKEIQFPDIGPCGYILMPVSGIKGVVAYGWGFHGQDLPIIKILEYSDYLKNLSMAGGELFTYNVDDNSVDFEFTPTYPGRENITDRLKMHMSARFKAYGIYSFDERSNESWINFFKQV